MFSLSFSFTVQDTKQEGLPPDAVSPIVYLPIVHHHCSYLGTQQAAGMGLSPSCTGEVLDSPRLGIWEFPRPSGIVLPRPLG